MRTEIVEVISGVQSIYYGVILLVK